MQAMISMIFRLFLQVLMHSYTIYESIYLCPVVASRVTGRKEAKLKQVHSRIQGKSCNIDLCT